MGEGFREVSDRKMKETSRCPRSPQVAARAPLVGPLAFLGTACPTPPPRLRQMCPTLAYVKEDCCISTLGSMQLKLSAGPVARTPPFQTPPACPPASTSATSTASTTCLPHLPPTLLPTPRPARLLPTHSRRTPHAAAAPSLAACPCPALPCC